MASCLRAVSKPATFGTIKGPCSHDEANPICSPRLADLESDQDLRTGLLAYLQHHQAQYYAADEGNSFTARDSFQLL